MLRELYRLGVEYYGIVEEYGNSRFPISTGWASESPSIRARGATPPGYAIRKTLAVLKHDGSTKAARNRMLTMEEYSEGLKLPDIET